MRLASLAISVLCAVTLNAATSTSRLPSTTNNDDSCDISVTPAATLLLPYFEVAVGSVRTVARTTLFSITNTSPYPQIARVTLWTDYAYPVLNFNLFLTGYDQQSIDLYDVLTLRGVAPPAGTTSRIDHGRRSLANDTNPNFAASATVDCEAPPTPIPADVLDDVRSALTRGLTRSCGASHVGGVHANAIGYITIDVVKTCSIAFPDNEAYYDELLYDNVLIGDSEIINPNPAIGNFADGNPMVHIRAVPEGGMAGVVVSTNLSYTFYDRYTPRTNADSAKMDRRQPLPSAFAARFWQGGEGAFNTSFEIWREGLTGAGAACADYLKNYSPQVEPMDMVRFDEHENPTTNYSGVHIAAWQRTYVIFPPSSSTPTSSGLFPPLSTSGDTGGWMYLNLHNGGSSAYSKARHSQNWVVVSTSADGRFSFAHDAVPLANGCTPAPAVGTIGPGPNSTP